MLSNERLSNERRKNPTRAIKRRDNRINVASLCCAVAACALFAEFAQAQSSPNANVASRAQVRFNAPNFAGLQVSGNNRTRPVAPTPNARFVAPIHGPVQPSLSIRATASKGRVKGAVPLSTDVQNVDFSAIAQVSTQAPKSVDAQNVPLEENPLPELPTADLELLDDEQFPSNDLIDDAEIDTNVDLQLTDDELIGDAELDANVDLQLTSEPSLEEQPEIAPETLPTPDQAQTLDMLDQLDQATTPSAEVPSAEVLPIEGSQPEFSSSPLLDQALETETLQSPSDEPTAEAPRPAPKEFPTPTPIPESNPTRRANKPNEQKINVPATIPRQKTSQDGGIVAQPQAFGRPFPPTSPMLYPNMDRYSGASRAPRFGAKQGVSRALLLPSEARAGLVVQQIPTLPDAPAQIDAQGTVPTQGYVDVSMLNATTPYANARPRRQFGVLDPPPLAMRKNTAAWGASGAIVPNSMIAPDDLAPGEQLVWVEQTDEKGLVENARTNQKEVDANATNETALHSKTLYSGLIAEIEYLGWQTEGANAYATIVGPSGEIFDDYALSPSGSGLRARLGYRALASWDVVATYTRFSANKNAVADANALGTNQSLVAPYGLGQKTHTDAIEGRLDVDLNVYDIEMGQWHYNAISAWRPFVGFRWTNLKENALSTLHNGNAFSQAYGNVLSDSTLDAYGLRLGGEWERGLFRGLSVFAKGAGTVAVGELSSQTFCEINGQEMLLRQSKRTNAAPSIEASLGLTIKRGNFSVKGGYEFNDWFNAVDLDGKTEDFLTHGWFAGISWNR